jgi:uncharacterized protein (TIGR02246 family)
MTNLEQIPALFDLWNEAVKSGDPDQVVARYAFNAVLLPTISNRVRSNHAEIRDYFQDFLTKRPNGTINESYIRVYNDIAIHSGTYTFACSPPDGEPFSVPARFTFVYQWFGDRWLIIKHHSSQMPEPV